MKKGFGKYLIMEYGWWILYFSWIALFVLTFFIGITFQDVFLIIFGFGIIIVGFIIAAISLIYDKYKEYKEQI